TRAAAPADSPAARAAYVASHPRAHPFPAPRREPSSPPRAAGPPFWGFPPPPRSVQGTERFDLGGWPRDDQLIGTRNRGFGPGIGEVFTAPFDAHHSDRVLLPQIRLLKCAAGRYVRGTGAYDREAVVEFDEIGHRAGYHVRDTLAQRRFGQHDVTRANTLEDAGMFPVDRLSPDFRDSQFGEAQHCQNAALDLGADAHDRPRKLVGADLAQRVRIAGVHRDGIREFVGVFLHQFVIKVDNHDLVVHAQ